MARKPHFITVNGTKLGFYTEDVYQSQGSTISSTVGVTESSEQSAPDLIFTVGALIDSGFLLRMRIRYQDGTLTKSALVLCALDKAPSAKGALVDKSFKGKDIKSAKIPGQFELR